MKRVRSCGIRVSYTTRYAHGEERSMWSIYPTRHHGVNMCEASRVRRHDNTWTTCDVLFHHVMSCRVMSYHILSWHVMSCHVMLFHTLHPGNCDNIVTYLCQRLGWELDTTTAAPVFASTRTHETSHDTTSASHDTTSSHAHDSTSHDTSHDVITTTSTTTTVHTTDTTHGDAHVVVKETMCVTREMSVEPSGHDAVTASTHPASSDTLPGTSSVTATSASPSITSATSTSASPSVPSSASPTATATSTSTATGTGTSTSTNTSPLDLSYTQSAPNRYLFFGAQEHVESESESDDDMTQHAHDDVMQHTHDATQQHAQPHAHQHADAQQQRKEEQQERFRAIVAAQRKITAEGKEEKTDVCDAGTGLLAVAMHDGTADHADHVLPLHTDLIAESAHTHELNGVTLPLPEPGVDAVQLLTTAAYD